jgi:phosphoglycerate dehydrogenase-like enzyme
VGDRPTILLAMMPGLLEYAFTPAQLARLAEIGELLNDGEPLDDLSTPEARELLARTDVLVGHWGCPTLTEDVMAAAPRLRLFAYAAGTVKWQVTDAVWARDVRVTSAAAANAVPVAEYTVAAILFANKGVFAFAAKERDPDAKVPLDPTRIGNVGRRVGLVGASHVGRLVIELLRPYDLEVAVADPYLSGEEARALGVTRMELDELCAWSELLSLHAPEVEATKGMIGAAQLAALPDGATLVNTARGGLVDEEALIAALSTGRISAVLDVTAVEPTPADSPLRTLPNVFLTPHIAGAAGAEMVRLAELAVDEVERWVRGEPARHPVRAEDLDRIA